MKRGEAVCGMRLPSNCLLCVSGNCIIDCMEKAFVVSLLYQCPRFELDSTTRSNPEENQDSKVFHIKISLKITKLHKIQLHYY